MMISRCRSTASAVTQRGVTITNASTSTLALSGSVSIRGRFYAIKSGGGSFSLAPGASKTVVVRPNPTGLLSTRRLTGALIIPYNGSNHPSPIEVPLTGIGLPLRPLPRTLYRGGCADPSQSAHPAAVPAASRAHRLAHAGGAGAL